jgi:hypothetical protein
MAGIHSHPAKAEGSPLRIAEDPLREAEDQEVKGRVVVASHALDDLGDRFPIAEVPARQLIAPERLEAQAVEPQHSTEEHNRQ